MRTIYEAFKKQVEARPNALAVIDEECQLTFKELDTMATEIAEGFPIKHPSKVGVVMNHSVRMIATILATG